MSLQEVINLVFNGIFCMIVGICGYYLGKNEAYTFMDDVFKELMGVLISQKKQPERRQRCMMCKRPFISKEEAQNPDLAHCNVCVRYEGVSDICEDCAVWCEQYRSKTFMENLDRERRKK